MINRICSAHGRATEEERSRPASSLAYDRSSRLLLRSHTQEDVRSREAPLMASNRPFAWRAQPTWRFLLLANPPTCPARLHLGLRSICLDISWNSPKQSLLRANPLWWC